nr:MAG TPA: hypothetical protein [Caudoviricetes sp.]
MGKKRATEKFCGSAHDRKYFVMAFFTFVTSRFNPHPHKGYDKPKKINTIILCTFFHFTGKKMRSSDKRAIWSDNL